MVVTTSTRRVNSYSTYVIELFLARDLHRAGPGGGVDDESITVHLVPISELTEWLANKTAQGCEVDGRVYAAPTLAGA